MPDRPSSTADDRVVISLRTRRRYQPVESAPKTSSRANERAQDELAQYARDGEPDDFRHRMIVNAAAFVFVLALVAAGVWLADTITTMRKTQDCLLAGKRGCAPVEAPVTDR